MAFKDQSLILIVQVL